jgi:hypothetical protein
MVKNKESVSISLDKKSLKDIDKIIHTPNMVRFENKSQVIRYCVSMQLPILLKQLEEEK